MKRALFISAAVMLFCAGAVYGAGYGDFGLGLQLGEPTGITGKYWVTNNQAIDGTVGWNIISDKFTLQAGYLFGFPISVTTGSLAAYVGVGGLMGGGSYHADHPVYPSESYIYLAGRVPLGLEYIYEPISFYGELDPLIKLLPAVGLDLGGGLGIRFYF